jgi:hypothetical protein
LASNKQKRVNDLILINRNITTSIAGTVFLFSSADFILSLRLLRAGS